MARVAELKNNLSRYLAYVREGGEVLVLDRDTPIARLVPFVAADASRTDASQGDERLGQMERQGLIARGNPAAVREWLDAGAPVAVPTGTPSLLGALLEMRDEDSR